MSGPSSYGVIGTGRIRVIVGTNPGAGVEVSETCPAGKRWRLVSMQLTLVTSAAVATRVVTIFIDDGTNTYQRTNGSGAQTASLTFNYCVGDFGVIQGGGSGTQLIPTVCNTILLPGHRIRTSTTALDAADDYAAPVYEVEEWDLL